MIDGNEDILCLAVCGDVYGCIYLQSAKWTITGNSISFNTALYGNAIAVTVLLTVK